MAAVIVTTTAPRRSVDRSVPRPPLQVIPGGRAAARAHAQAHRASRPVPAAVYRRRRVGALLVVASLALVAYLVVSSLAASVGAVTGPASAATARPGGRVHVVQPGDTVWSIARSLHPHGDIRIVVDRLEARLGGATLQPGQRVPLDGLTS
jgi:hypothetical protein